MKKLATRAFSSLALLSLLAAAPAAAADLTLPQLIEKNHQARGGDAAWKSLKGIKAIQVVEGDSGWHLMPFTGNPDAQKSSPEQLKQAKRMSDFSGPLFDSEKKGYQLELLGREDVAGTPAYKLKVTQAGESSTLYVDANTFLEFKEVRSAETDQGATMTIEILIGDYKTVGGLLIPHSIQTKMQGTPQGQTVSIKTAELNPPVPTDYFKMPPPAPKPAAVPPANPQ